MRPALRSTLAALLILSPTAAFAQDGYLLEVPRASFTLRGGAALPSARDGVFDMFTRELTLEKSDFTAFSLGGDLAVRLSSRADAVLGVAVAKSTSSSEFRDWVDQDDKPIEQTTTLRRSPVTASLRVFPFERGRAVGKFAWVPSAAVLPYVGAGGGLMFYALEQHGDFVDFETLEVYSDNMRSRGTTLTGHVMAGAEWWPSARFGVSGEARYSWAKATLNDSFSEFDRIDLQGMQWTAGISARF